MQLEDPCHPALGDVRDLLGHVAAPQRNGTTPTADNGDELLTVLLPTDGRSDDAGTGLVGPKYFSGLGVGGFEFAVRRTPEHQIALGDQGTAPQRGWVFDFPDNLARGRIDSAQGSDIVVEHFLDGEACAQEGSALLVRNRLVPDIHAPFVRRHIEKSGVRAIGRSLLVGAAQERWRGEHARTFLTLGALHRISWTVLRNEDRTTGFGRSEERRVGKECRSRW